MNSKRRMQQGMAIIWLPFLMLVFLALTSLVIDIGLIYNARIQLQKATDSAALAGALQLLLQTPSNVNATVQLALTNNAVDGTAPTNVVITQGIWDDTAQTFNATNTNPSAVKVSASYTRQFYFAEIFSDSNYTLTRTSIASIVDNRPLNIMVVADLSAHMSHSLPAVKNAVSYLSTKLNSAKDKLGLAVISSTSNLAVNLTSSYSTVLNQLNSYQAGGSADGTIAPAIDSAQAGFTNNTSPNGKKIILLFANGKTLWYANTPTLLYDVSFLKANSIYGNELVIGPESYASQSTNFTTGTDGLLQTATQGATDYTSQTDAFYKQFKLGPPRLVQ